jgi:hypothetical protein
MSRFDVLTDKGIIKQRDELLTKISDISQIASITPTVRSGGKSYGVRTFEVDNGSGLQFTVLESKCLDIFTARYKGVNLNFVSKAGLTAPQNYNPHGREFLYQFQGGLLYTCGLSNVGPACEADGIAHPMHGRIGNQPAENVGVRCGWTDAGYTMEISGEMRHAALFNENLRLKRVITTVMGENRIVIEDTVSNSGYDRQALMLLYHFNFGYPLLDEGARFLLNREFSAEPRDTEAAKGFDRFGVMQKPLPKFNEHVYYHTMKPAGPATAYILNEKLGFGAYVSYDARELPELIEWKSMASGDYALGIEPANCRVSGRDKEEAAGRLKYLEPGESKKVRIEFGIIDGKDEMRKCLEI